MNHSETGRDEIHMSLHRVFGYITEKDVYETRAFANSHVMTEVPLLTEGPSINR
jgi:hypothetical protein